MRSDRRQARTSRRRLAQLARSEAELGLRGGDGLAGPDIERYLSVFRDALNSNASTDKYSDVRVGYDWCGAFVYYCCLKAGFRIPPKPVPSFRYTLAAVPAWHHWARVMGFFHEGPDNPRIGDIGLYNGVYDGKPLDHIGIVVRVSQNSVSSAEGNNDNRAGVFRRAYDCIAGFVRLPEDAESWGTLDRREGTGR